MSGIDIHSLTWRTIESWVKKEIETARDQLEAPGRGQESTEDLRGQIHALRRVLALAKPKEVFPSEAPDYGLATDI